MKRRCMTLAFLALMLFLYPRLTRACSPTEIDSLAAVIEERDGELKELDAKLAALRDRLGAVTREIGKEKAGRPGSRGVLSRMRIEKLLKKSRSLSDEMEALARLKSRRRSARMSARGRLRACLEKLVAAGWANVLEAIRDHRFEDARTALESTRNLEGRLSDLGDHDVPRREYPLFTEDVIRNYLRTEDDRRFLMGMMWDQMDKALRDSSVLARKRSEARTLITQKRDLLALLDEAEDAGVEGASFFDDFDKEELTFEIKQLEEREGEITSALEKAREAIAYYLEHIRFIEGLEAADYREKEN